MIYFVQSVDGGPVKIGTTEDIECRVSRLESHYRTPLALLGVIPGGREAERSIHERFAHLRLGRTEQFQPTQELMEFIGKPLLVAANAAAVRSIRGWSGIVFSFKANLAWREWLHRLADHCRTDAAKVIDRAVIEYAARQKFEEKAPDR